ncbi:MAG: hypothetical protein PHS73_02885 [Candidatus Peribacteraceae bacterium]|nr:hypothetical protein [Candidatus Peribacteraceae bacterium]
MDDQAGSREHRQIGWAKTSEPEGRKERMQKQAKEHRETESRAQQLSELFNVIDDDAALQKRWQMIMKDGEAKAEEIENYRNAVMAKMMQSREKMVGEKKISESFEDFMNLLPRRRQDMIAIGLQTGVISIQSLAALERRRMQREQQAAPQQEQEPSSQEAAELDALATRYVQLVSEQFRGISSRESQKEKTAIMRALHERDPEIVSRLQASLRQELPRRAPVRDLSGRTGAETRREMEVAQRTRRDEYFAERSARDRREMSSEDLARDPRFRQAMLSRPGGASALERIDARERQIRSNRSLLEAMGITGDADDYNSRGFNRRAMSEGRYAPRTPGAYASSYDRDAYPSQYFHPFGRGEGERYMAKQNELKESYADSHWNDIQGAMSRGEYAKYADDPAYDSIMRAYAKANAQWISNPDRRYGDIAWFRTQMGELAKRHQQRELMRETLQAAQEGGNVLGKHSIAREGGYGPEDRVRIAYTGPDGTPREFVYAPYYETGQPGGTNLTQWEDFVEASGLVIHKKYYRSATYETMSYSRPRVKGLEFVFTKPGRFTIDGTPVLVAPAGQRPSSEPIPPAPRSSVRFASSSPKPAVILSDRVMAIENVPDDVLNRFPQTLIHLDQLTESKRPGGIRIFRDGSKEMKDSETIDLRNLTRDGMKTVASSFAVRREGERTFRLFFLSPGAFRMQWLPGNNDGPVGGFVKELGTVQVKKQELPAESTPPAQPRPAPAPQPAPQPPAEPEVIPTPPSTEIPMPSPIPKPPKDAEKPPKLRESQPSIKSPVPSKNFLKESRGLGESRGTKVKTSEEPAVPQPKEKKEEPIGPKPRPSHSPSDRRSEAQPYYTPPPMSAPDAPSAKPSGPEKKETPTKLGEIKSEAELKTIRDAESPAVRAIVDEYVKGPFRKVPESHAVSLAKLAEKGNFLARLMLGAVYVDGLLGEDRDFEKARQWLKRSLELPHTAKERSAVQEQLKILDGLQDKKDKSTDAAKTGRSSLAKFMEAAGIHIG